MGQVKVTMDNSKGEIKPGMQGIADFSQKTWVIGVTDARAEPVANPASKKGETESETAELRAKLETLEKKMAEIDAEKEKAARLAALFAAAESERRAHLEGCVGTRVRVLVEGRGKAPGTYTGRTERNEIVHFTASEDPTGKLVDLTVVRAFKNSLEATLPGDPLTRPARSPEPDLETRRLLPVL